MQFSQLLTGVLSSAFLLYITYSLWTLSQLFKVTSCNEAFDHCIPPILRDGDQLQVKVFTSAEKSVRWSDNKSLTEVLTVNNFDPSVEWKRSIAVTTVPAARHNGSMYAHVFVLPTTAQSPQSTDWLNTQTVPLTKYELPQASTFQLIGDSSDSTTSTKLADEAVGTEPVSHWQSRLTINVVSERVSFDPRNIPGELYRYLQLYQRQKYVPIMFVGDLTNRIKDLVPLNESSEVMTLDVEYQPISAGTLRLWVTMMESFRNLRELGFQNKDIDEMKGLLIDTNLYILLLTFLVAAFHLLFDFLAFKNDISYWRHRNSLVGLSTRTVLWRCGSTFVIFLYLLDQQTSLLVLVPAGIGTVIEFWKVSKVLKVDVAWNGIIPHISLGSSSEQEMETEALDSEAMGKLSYLLYPLCVAGAVYSLVYTPHRSWYSWCIQSLVNGVYAFGFLFMLPQLYINYKLKSVAHLPWRAFMYKAFNTFIDDVFAFIITMPTAHRLACFRDDIVFVIYLYQRWLYPVDMARVNEFGQAFDDSGDGRKKKKKKD